MTAVIAFVLAGAAAAPELTGDFDGDGRADRTSITHYEGGRWGVAVNFANGRRAGAFSGSGLLPELTLISAAQFDRMCAEKTGANRRSCSRLTGRDAIWIERGSKESLTIWSGNGFISHVGLFDRP